MVVRLLLAVPWFVASFVVLVIVTTPPRVMVSEVLGDPDSFTHGISMTTWLVVGGWLLSGVLVLWQPVEGVLARLVSGLKQPTPSETAILTGAWRDVRDRAGVPLGRYTIWIQPSEEINASAAAGHTIAVTRRALTLPADQLRAVLAHELGHHLGGHPIVSRLALWYSVPARAALQASLVLVRIVCQLYNVLAGVVVGIFGAVVPGGGCLLGLVDLLVRTVGMLVSFAVVVGLAWIPAALAWCDRLDELQADRAAAQLGYGPALMDLLYDWMPDDDHARSSCSRVDLLLSTHPSMRTRIRALQRYRPSARRVRGAGRGRGRAGGTR